MMAQMSRGRLDLLRPLNRCLAAANAQLHPAALSSGGRSSRVLPSHRTGSGHSGLRSACRLPSEACRSHRFLPDVRAALREVCRITKKQLSAMLGVSRTTIGKLRTQGRLKARICNDQGEWLYWPPEQISPLAASPAESTEPRVTSTAGDAV